METEDSSHTLPKSRSFSPKVARPKLPPFAGSGRSVSPRSKTDPGRGEIKAIMEDIMNLKKTDWKTYSRCHTSPRSKGKSLSTNSSPSATPRIGSPVSDESKSGFTRDRSRSLKLLTDRLKHKNSKPPDWQTTPASQDYLPEQDTKHVIVSRAEIPIFKSSKEQRNPQCTIGTMCSEGSPHHSPDRKSAERYEKIPEDVEEESEALKSPLAASSEESFRSVTDLIHDDGERSPDSDTLGIREKSPESDIIEHKDIERNLKSPTSPVTDDEGIAETEHTQPVISTYIYHPIPRNSKFLQLAATKPPKRFPQERRSGISMLTHRAKAHVSKHKGDQKHEEIEDQSHGKPHKRKEPGKSNYFKSSTRFVTHPPHTKASNTEDGSLDTNGFSSLKSTSVDNDEFKDSHGSLADSQIASETYEDQSYQDVMEHVLSENVGISDRKNGKSKPKSKSDPSGDRVRDLMDFSTTLESPQSQSAPLLSKEELEAREDIDEDDFKQKSLSENALTQSTVSEEGTEEHSSEDEMYFRVSDLNDTDHNRPSRHKPTASAPNTPHGPSPSPASTLERPSHLLAVPSSSGRKPNIFRSASSASVLQNRKASTTPSRDKDVVRKYSITTDEAMINPSKSAANLVPDFLPIGDMSNASSMPAVWNKDRIQSTDSPEREPGFFKDKRYHIVEELYKNEKEYVEALRTLKDKYMVPLKTQSSVDEAIVDNIFYMIPEILTHHSIYLDFLDNVWKHWDTGRSTVGNIITTIFAKQTVLESYKSFVENYNASGKFIENTFTTKSSVQKFIEQCQKDSGSKLTMKDLIVRPIQRIPRYELLIQRLLDNTSQNHPDYPLLEQACRVMHDLAVKIGTVNDTQHEVDMQDSLKKLELLLITDLAVPDRAYIRHDMVQLFNKKDQCCIWLFSDVIIISSIKRKSGPVTRKVSIILKSPYGQDFAENIKHKVWLRIGLDDLEIVKSQATLTRKQTIDKDQVEDDLTVVTQMADLATKLSCQHQGLDELIKEMNGHLSRQLLEANARNASLESNKLELLVTTQEGVLHLVTGFSSAEKRASWEAAFLDAKQKLSLLSDKRAPEFLQPLQITKTRAGMQFSCAAPIDGVNSSGYRDVWVCNSDGYVGHMCLLSLQPEPIVTLNTPVPGCNARILCICAVPAFSGAFRRRTSQKGQKSQRDSLVPSIQESPRIKVEKAEEELEVASHLSESPAMTSSAEGVEDGYQSESDSSDDDEPVSFINRPDELYVGELLSDDEIPSKASVSELTENSPDPISTSGNWDQDPVKSTMWLGTEDGCIHIFQSCDNIKTTKNKLKIQHSSPVCCIIYLDNKVFVSLVNGDLIVYKRDHEGMWDTERPYTRTIGSVSSPITKMLAVAGKLWCGCQNKIHVINPLALNIETSFHVSPNSARAVHCMVSSGQGVWVAAQQASKVALFHAVTFDFLLEVSIAQAVAQKLQSADDIIRQHKAACLRITALLVCKDLLWVGTSAGVILTIPIPRITSTTSRGSIAPPIVTGLVYGHTGHVRFLTSVEMNSSSVGKSENSPTSNDADRTGSFSFQDIHRRSSMAATTATMASRMLVISGGDGYEDFRNSAANEAAGRDDSTNHLLLWQV